MSAPEFSPPSSTLPAATAHAGARVPAAEVRTPGAGLRQILRGPSGLGTAGLYPARHDKPPTPPTPPMAPTPPTPPTSPRRP